MYGKDIYQVLKEINEQKVLQMADELNMDKTNMNVQELAEKIKRISLKRKRTKFCTSDSNGCGRVLFLFNELKGRESDTEV